MEDPIEFHSADYQNGDSVWFQNETTQIFEPGTVLEYHPRGNVLTIQNLSSQVFTVENNNQVKKRTGDLNYADQVGFNDMISMSDLTEPALLWNVKARYENGIIYTYVGSILISVNPYKMFDIYGLPNVKKYEGRVLGALEPHLFSIGSSAYDRMNKDNSSQVIVISGESGSGKTESTKLIMGYLALVNKSPSNLITEQILEASPLLESFGNAKTIKNDNSSRFGKFIQVYFNGRSSTSIITGSRITEYLLEKSRIVTQASEERNYHVFYELLKGLNKETKEKYGLLSPEKYFYLNQGGSCVINGKNDKEDFDALLSAMQILGFSSDEQDGIFRILSAVLHLGNVYFHRKSLKHGQEGVEIGSDAEIQWIAHLLELNPEGIRKALTTRTTEARNEKMLSPLTIDQSLDSRDAIAKVLYSNLFTWLVHRINKIVFKGESSISINILDIFGFEDFKDNSFEQLCINYANESLQHYLNKHIFKLEQMEYMKEKIDWVQINYEDNLPVINLLSKKPVGILHLLDDESNFPKATDLSFLEKSHYNHALNEYYLRPRMVSSEFGVKHYAGPVWYNVDGFLDKNRDTLRSDVVKLLQSSRSQMISRMVMTGLSIPPIHSSSRRSNGRFITMKPRAPTVAARFCDSLSQLLESISKCDPWFVRCIKPNNQKAPMTLELSVVTEQLRYSGILETIKIRKLGYPIRQSFQSFTHRYKCLLKMYSRLSSDRDLTRLILHSEKDYQIGCTKVFLRESLEQKLESSRYNLFNRSATIIQSNVRSYLCRKRYLNFKQSAIKIQSYYRMFLRRKEFNTYKRKVVTLQSFVRMWIARGRYAKALEISKRKTKGQQGKFDMSRAVAGVNHLEIPAELAFILSKCEAETEKKSPELQKLTHSINRSKQTNYEIKNLTYQHNIKNYVDKNLKTNIFNMKREPISNPFLNNSPHEESLTIFKLILRFMNDGNLNGRREQALLNYIVNKGINNPNLRDEIYVQLMNQTKKNENQENLNRAYLLIASCLCAFPPSENLYPFLLKYVSDFGNQFAYSCQSKLLSMDLDLNRFYPPSVLEVKSILNRVNVAVHINERNYRVDSWDFVGELADFAVSGISGEESRGWSLEIADVDSIELNSSGYLLDHFSRNEALPGFTRTQTIELFPRRDGNKAPPPAVCHNLRPLNPPPAPPQEKSLMLSGSVLNDRYFEKKSKSLENILLEDNYKSLGLSSSKLNDRYHSIENLDYKENHSVMEDEIEIELGDEEEEEEDERDEEADDDEDDVEMELQSSSAFVPVVRSGNPRFIKATSYHSKKNSIAGSYSGSSRAYIERSDIKSSALSDTSEAPSLASHVRRVRVPSQASDVDQFLDDLFSPVLDGNLDDLSDARSLVTSIKGGGHIQINERNFSPINENLFGYNSPFQGEIAHTSNLQRAAFLQSAMAQNIQIQQQLIAQNNALQHMLQQQLSLETTTNTNESRLTPSSHKSSRVISPSSLELSGAFSSSRKNSSEDDAKNQSSGNSSGHHSSGHHSSANHPISDVPNIPPPPPLPMDLIEGHRPFMDPYGRAKTVRIGKWRWPPLAGEEITNPDSFQEFKNRLQEKRKLDEWGDDVVENRNNGNAFIGGKKLSRNFGDGVVGKLKLSNEMRQKLEQVTSVRGPRATKPPANLPPPNLNHPKEKPQEPEIRKIDENRRLLLQEKLAGKFQKSSEISLPPPTIATNYSDYDGISTIYNGGASTGMGVEFKSSPNFLEPLDDIMKDDLSEEEVITTKLLENNQNSCYGYNQIKLALRKEVFYPNENLNNFAVDLVFVQVVRDLRFGSRRIFNGERSKGRNLISGYCDLDENWDTVVENARNLKVGVKRALIECAKNWELYFWRFFPVQTSRDVNYLAVNASGVKLVNFSQVNNELLNVSHSFSWDEISDLLLPKSSLIHLIVRKDSAENKWSFYTNRAKLILQFANVFLSRRELTPVKEVEDVNGTVSNNNQWQQPPSSVGNVTELEEPEELPKDDGKHSLLQFAIKYFRQEKFDLGKTDPKSRNEWTWRQQMDLVKYSNKMLECSLLPLDEHLNSLALECFHSILKYMGDSNGKVHPTPPNEVEAVYTLLRNCHSSSSSLHDEIYCEIMKQTTNNTTRSAQRGWRLFTIIAAYFTCSDILKPYLFKYLETNAYDKRRAFHGTALVTLQNLRKTFKYGGRRNVPSVEEITAITAGRNAKRQIFRLPGGTQRVVNIKATTVVQDVIDEMCVSLNVVEPEEREEFSVYCIVDGDTFTMPLQKEEYILDVTTELHKNQQVFYLIFCRSVWFFPMRLDSNLYVEVVFNQIAPDYLEGFLLRMPGQTILQDTIYDIARIASLLHRAADLTTAPTLKETKYLLPKPALAARSMSPNRWVALVNNYWNEDNVPLIMPLQAKATVLEILEKWDLFGSSFFSVKRISEPAPSEEYILSLNKHGVHFLDLITHETITSWPYNDIISTRKVKNEDGILYLDMKYGNLMQQKIIRLQTEHAHEISRLIRQYIHIQKYNKNMN